MITEKNKQHYYWLDVIRFLAAFAVMACHYRGFFFVEYGALSPDQQNIPMQIFFLLTRLGDEAVMVFFVLSGFLVGGKAIDKARKGIFDIKNYAIDRFVRIILPLLSSMLLCIPITIFVMNENVDWYVWIMNLFSMQGIFVESLKFMGPLWSLSYEVWFYITIAALIAYICNYKRILAAIILLICAAVFIKLKTAYLFIWFMGALAFLNIPKKFNAKVFIPSLFVIIIAIMVLQIFRDSRSLSAVILGEDMRMVVKLVMAFFICIFISYIINIKPNGKISCLINNVGTKAAAWSYTLYLVHAPIGWMLTRIGFQREDNVNLYSIAMYITAMLICIIITYCVYWCFEKRTAVVKKFLKKHLIKENVSI